MALSELTPFTPENFRSAVDQFIQWATDHVETVEIHGHKGWLAQLRDYCWRGGLEEGVRTRKDFHERMANDAFQHEFRGIVDDICNWGRMKHFKECEIRAIAGSIGLLHDLRNGNHVSLSDLFIHRVAAVTKVYEMQDPHSWVIYDSRVARGLALLVRKWWKEIGAERNQSLIRFPWPPGRGELYQPDGFPHVGATAPRQPRLAFVYASWLAKILAERLRDICPASLPSIGPDHVWQPYHVEMVLFVLGQPGKSRSRR